MEETWELAALAMRALRTYCLGVSAALILAACQSPDASVQTFDASSDVKFQQSLIRIETQLNADEKLALSKAIRRLESYPQDGNCAVTNLLAHAQKAADLAFLQKLRLTRLHGLTAQQVIDVAEEKNCDVDAGINSAIDSPEFTSEQKEALNFEPIKPVRLEVEYMLTDFTPLYAVLNLSCFGSNKISIFTQFSRAPMQITESGTVVTQTGEINMQWRPFWQQYSVFFDEILMSFPPKYKTITKTRTGKNGEHETMNERILLRTDEVIDDLLLAKLKTAKNMRLQNPSGVGPSFDLTTIKTDIENLEAQCALKDVE